MYISNILFAVSKDLSGLNIQQVFCLLFVRVSWKPGFSSAKKEEEFGMLFLLSSSLCTLIIWVIQSIRWLNQDCKIIEQIMTELSWE